MYTNWYSKNSTEGTIFVGSNGYGGSGASDSHGDAWDKFLNWLNIYQI